MAIVLAFSGGLDTSFCVPYLRETTDSEVITVTVDTGGTSRDGADAIARRARELGASRHVLVDARRDLFDRHLQYLIKGNVLRGGVYPLSVGPERTVQAQHVARVALESRATAVAHGSTGAGNDQIRFDVALRVFGGESMKILTPIRALGYSREQTTAYLEERGFEVQRSISRYSINRGLWGTTIGGGETITTSEPLPESAYPDTTAPGSAPDEAARFAIRFAAGVPVAIDGVEMDPVAAIEYLNELGGQHGVGRGIHVGDTILGIKGRVGFEAPAAVILIESHRELEKLVLSRWQLLEKNRLGDLYGTLIHEGHALDPAVRDIEAFFDSSQAVVDGTVRVELFKGSVRVLGADSPYSLFDAAFARYGEANSAWTGEDARGFSRVFGVPAALAARARKRGVAETDDRREESV